MKSIEYNNVFFIVGKNKINNWEILDKYYLINNKYIWFHLRDFPSCYVIMLITMDELNMMENNIKNNYLYYGSELCKNNTNYKNFNKIKIIYTTINNLKKTKNVGEVKILDKKNILIL